MRFRSAAVVESVAFVAWGWWSLVCQQAGPSIDPGFASLLGNLGVIGVLVWHLWYHTTKGYPNVVATFAAEAEKQRKVFADEMQAERLERKLERDQSARELAEMRGMLINVLQGMRTAVHDVKDTAQTAINRAAAAQQAGEKK